MSITTFFSFGLSHEIMKLLGLVFIVLCIILAVCYLSPILDRDMVETIRFYGDNPFPQLTRHAKFVAGIEGLNIGTAIMLLFHVAKIKFLCSNKTILLGEIAGLVPLGAYLGLFLLLVSGAAVYENISFIFFALLCCVVLSTTALVCNYLHQIFIRKEYASLRLSNVMGLFSGVFAFVPYLHIYISLKHIPL